MRLLLGCVLVVSACIQSELVPCGDQLCARGAMCIGGSICANADQLSACSSVEDGDVCALATGTVGHCTMGVCEPSGCGNDRLDLGEVCDDGNVTAGDGCSGTCDSDETCGNGVLDASKGESCDCGADDTKVPSSCTGPNSDDPRSPCTTTCRLRRCGDGMVAGPEQCDGDMIADSATCSSFGFYSGTVSCSPFCQFDVTSCDERCGDSIVQTAYEACDGGAPADQTCLDFGYDLGWLGCTSVCTPKLSDCDRLGWSRVHPRVEAATHVVPRADRLLVRFQDGDVSLLINDTPADPTGTFLLIAGTETDSYAIGETSVAHTTTGTWQNLPTAPPWSTSPSAAFASGSLGLIVAVSNSASVYQWTGATWVTYTLPTGPLVKPVIGGSKTTPYVFDTTTNVIAAWNGTGFVSVTPPPNTLSIRDVAETTTSLYVATEDGLYSRNLSQSGFADEGIAATKVVANSQGGVDVLTTSGAIVRLGNGALQFAAPPGTGNIAESNGRIYVGLASGVFAILKGGWQSIPPPSVATTSWVFIHPSGALKDDSVFLTGSSTAELEPGRGWTPILVPAGTTDVVRTETALVSISATSITVDRGVSVTVKDFVTITPRMLYYSQNSGVVFIAGDRGVATFTIATNTLAEKDLNADLRAIDGSSMDNVFAVGTDRATARGLVVRYNSGADWTPLDIPLVLQPLRDVFVTPTGVAIAIGRNAIYTGSSDITKWTSMAVPGSDLKAISGTKEDDYFVAGSAQFGFPFSGIAHWDGSHLYPVRLPGNGAPHEIFVSPGAVYMLLTDSTTPVDSVWALVRATHF
jgi:cysteine-rich repeat protein